MKEGKGIKVNPKNLKKKGKRKKKNEHWNDERLLVNQRDGEGGRGYCKGYSRQIRTFRNPDG